jgi:hypothetical protein
VRSTIGRYLALPRVGVPAAFEVAQVLRAPIGSGLHRKRRTHVPAGGQLMGTCVQ